ncbi:FG-GAP repeat domain-containing protein, partial [Stenoxybacter acetivorans]|uniref:FG-GAP repeat domain-containing protein n=1 Tax=Stenoxybacter acetivorans TaxID=422441 RepID=UPI00055CFD51
DEVKVGQTDTSGNKSPETTVQVAGAPDDISTTFTLLMDTTDGLPSSHTGDFTTRMAVNDDLITRDSTPATINGQLSRNLLADERLQISVDGVKWEDITVSGTDWNYSNGNTYTADTVITYQMRVLNGANASTALQERTVNVDLTSPNGINTAPNVPQLIGMNDVLNFSSADYGTAEKGSKVALVDDVNGNSMIEEGIDKIVGWAEADDSGAWSMSNITLSAGSHNLGFWVFDKAGNISSASPSVNTGVSSSDTGAQTADTGWGGTTDGGNYSVNAAAVTIGVNSNWNFWQSVAGPAGTGNRSNAGRVYSITDPTDGKYQSVYLAEPSRANGATDDVNGGGYGHFVNAAVFADYNRDGYFDVLGQTSDYGNGGYTVAWLGKADGTYQPQSIYQGRLNHNGGVVAFDKEGDGYLDFVLADSEPDSTSFLWNHAGANGVYLATDDSEISPDSNNNEGLPNITASTVSNGLGTNSVTGKAINQAAFAVTHEVGGVDIDNNGTIDVVAHTDYGNNAAGTYANDNNSRAMGVFYNTGKVGGEFTYMNYGSVFDSDGAVDYGVMSQSTTFADFNGDGWLDLYINRGSKNNASSAESRIYLNDGTGQLQADDAHALWFGDTMSGGTSFAVDWNFDGLIDVIEVPRQDSGNDGQGNSALNQKVSLYLNNGSGSWGASGAGIQFLSGADNQITGAVALDYDWDGSLDLILYKPGVVNNTANSVTNSDSSASSILVKNTNIAADGTALHVRIVDGFGINTFYGNTVKLYDSKGVCVGTQLINPQSAGSSNSMGLVSFYGLDANETYSVQMLNAVHGSSANVGSVSGVQGSAANGGGYTNQVINTNWGNLKAIHSNEAYVLTAEAITAENNAGTNSGNANSPFGTGISGTGYNDHFFGTLGNDYYNGGGGWEVDAYGAKVWSETGGVDVLDYSRMTGWNITVDMELGVVAKVKGTDQYSDFFVNVEQVIGSGGNDEMVGGKGDDTL